MQKSKPTQTPACLHTQFSVIFTPLMTVDQRLDICIFTHLSGFLCSPQTYCLTMAISQNILEGSTAFSLCCCHMIYQDWSCGALWQFYI